MLSAETRFPRLLSCTSVPLGPTVSQTQTQLYADTGLAIAFGLRKRIDIFSFLFVQMHNKRILFSI